MVSAENEVPILTGGVMPLWLFASSPSWFLKLFINPTLIHNILQDLGAFSVPSGKGNIRTAPENLSSILAHSFPTGFPEVVAPSCSSSSFFLLYCWIMLLVSCWEAGCVSMSFYCIPVGRSDVLGWSGRISTRVAISWHIPG